MANNMSYDEQLAQIEEEQDALHESMQPIHTRLYELRIKREKLLLEKELNSGTLTKKEQLEFRRAMHLYVQVLKQANTSSIYIDEAEPENQKKFSFECTVHYSFHNSKPETYVNLHIKSKVIPVHKLLESMIQSKSLTGQYWDFHRWHPIHVEGTLTEEEYEQEREKLNEE